MPIHEHRFFSSRRSKIGPKHDYTWFCCECGGFAGTWEINEACPQWLCHHARCSLCVIERVLVPRDPFLPSRTWTTPTWRGLSKPASDSLLSPQGDSHKFATPSTGVVIDSYPSLLDFPPPSPSSSGSSHDLERDEDFDDGHTHEIGDSIVSRSLSNEFSATARDMLPLLFARYEEWLRQATSAPSGSGSGGASSSRNTRHEDQQSSTEGPPRKRRRTDDNGDSAEEKEPSIEVALPDGLETIRLDRRLFACPFWKENSSQWRYCFRYRLRRIQDVKQHLRRVHAQSCHCVRCGHEFPCRQDRDSHYASAIPCETRPFRRKWLTDDQTESLKKKSNPKHTADQQWYAIWDVVFPDHPRRPDSPYLDGSLSEDLSSFRDFFLAEGPSILRESIGPRSAMYERQALQLSLTQIYNQWASARGQSMLDPDGDTSAGSSSAAETPPSAIIAAPTPGMFAESSGAETLWPWDCIAESVREAEGGDLHSTPNFFGDDLGFLDFGFDSYPPGDSGTGGLNETSLFLYPTNYADGFGELDAATSDSSNPTDSHGGLQIGEEPGLPTPTSMEPKSPKA
ncbi:hypothetical protein B0T26DRAFT_718302 [Lasiosphaeria miniovina]|uniref:C2H2-type domain-containing protein n=1 Tax=Lasiosphaeria miniovina TaxID=1954250 RepID=A0AA40ADH3_9PEZI|nr:uncharacterized protein B0T26DRAFT_718302 [Lasiosphaeria miniovina]KAK0713769.1 hypothetical protein B0T26DRAFT_718302 [Lasiosphaeria miniovina]